MRWGVSERALARPAGMALAGPSFVTSARHYDFTVPSGRQGRDARIGVLDLCSERHRLRWPQRASPLRRGW